MHIFTTLTVAFLMVYASGCGCTEVGCSDDVVIDLNKASGVWEPGKYVIAIDGDGRKLDCTAYLPLVTEPTCQDQFGMNVTFDAEDAGASGSAFKSVQVFFAPAKLTLTITRDGIEVAKKTFTPTYADQEPNGALCGPTCKVAQDALAVP